MNRLLRIVSFILLASPVFAQPDHKILLPVVIHQPLAGAYGSIWDASVSVLDRGTAPVFVAGLFEGCNFDPCLAVQVPPNTTYVGIRPPTTGEVPGRFLYVDSGRVGDLNLHLRVVDLSRQALTWGTDVPVIDESNARQSAIDLLDVPVSTDFRSLLRVYDFDPGAAHVVDVQILKQGTRPDEVVYETELTLQPTSNTRDYPGFAALYISGLPGVGTTDSVRVRVAPVSSGLRFWAMVSATHNSTQHVTIIAP